MYRWLNIATTTAAHDAPATAIAQRAKNPNEYIELLVYLKIPFLTSGLLR
jgi:hypothetical protein